MIALAGLAEYVLHIELLIRWGALVVLIILILVTCINRLKVLSAICVIICLLFGVLFQPWSVFGHQDSSDGDVIYWVRQFRVNSIVWIASCVAAIISLPLACREKRQRSDKEDEPPDQTFNVPDSQKE